MLQATFLRKRRCIRACRWLLALCWATCATTTLCMVSIDVETIIVGGLFLLPLAGLLVWCGFAARWRAAAAMGVSHCLVAIPFFVLAQRWGPPQAEVPFSIMGIIYTACMAGPTMLVWRRTPLAHQPWQCQACGYALFGVSQPRCPECGQPFDPARLPALVPPEDSPDSSPA